jgi:hypothetical protein
MPVVDACRTARAWHEVRQWLSDLAHELSAQAPYDRPPLTIDRVWILHTGRARLIDDPGLEPDAGPDGEAAGRRLLLEVASLTRASNAVPWPAGATRLFARLSAAAPPPLAEIVRELDALGRRAPAIRPSSRGLTIAAQAAAPVVFAAFATVMLVRTERDRMLVPPDLRVTVEALKVLDRTDRGVRPLAPDDRAALERLLATSYRATLSDPRLGGLRGYAGLSASARARAVSILHRPVPPDAGDAAARPAVKRVIGDALTHQPRNVLDMLLGTGFGTLVVVAAIALTAALLGGGVLRVVGFAVVRDDGRPASRLRMLARTAAAWSPVLVSAIPTAVWRLDAPAENAIMATAVAMMIGGAAYAIARPSRSLQDRIAGTWLVPQ